MDPEGGYKPTNTFELEQSENSKDPPLVEQLSEADFFRKKHDLEGHILEIEVGTTRVLNNGQDILNQGASYCMELYVSMPDSGQMLSGHYPTTEHDPRYTNPGLERSFNSYKEALEIVRQETKQGKHAQVFLFGQDITGSNQEIRMRAQVIQDFNNAGVQNENISDFRAPNSGDLDSTIYSAQENKIFLKRAR